MTYFPLLINRDDPLNPIDIESLISKDSNGLLQNCLGNAFTCAETAALHQIDTSVNTTISGLLAWTLPIWNSNCWKLAHRQELGAITSVTNTAVGIDDVVTAEA